MGNNHNKYFGANKRKIILVGLSASGKTSKYLLFNVLALLRLMKEDKKGVRGYVPTEGFNNEQVSKGSLELDVWDLGGKLPHLWVHYFAGTQGVIFVIDDLSVALADPIKA